MRGLATSVSIVRAFSGYRTRIPAVHGAGHEGGVVTPAIGLGWMIGEDAADKYLIRRIEGWTTNKWIRLAARTGLNATRSFANLVQGNVPWSRETREGILSYRSVSGFARDVPPAPMVKPAQEIPDPPGPAPFEFNTTFQPERLSGDGRQLFCLGGSGAAAFRIAPEWQLVAEVGGCKLVGVEDNKKRWKRLRCKLEKPRRFMPTTPNRRRPRVSRSQRRAAWTTNSAGRFGPGAEDGYLVSQKRNAGRYAVLELAARF